MSKVIVAKGIDPKVMVLRALDNFTKPHQEKIVIKPNLVNDEPPPTTTPYETVEALVEYYHKEYDVIVAEGSGWCDTTHAYEVLGYHKIARKYRIKLVDLNNDFYEVKKNPKTLVLEEFEFPLTLKNSYIISTPILKEHSQTDVTISLKNMLGSTLGGKAKVARKGRFHRLGIDECIVDVNLYLRPNLAVVDGIVAGVGGELGARPKKLGIMIFSEDLVAADAVGAKYLGYQPLHVRHLKLAQEKGLGIVDLDRVEIVETI